MCHGQKGHQVGSFPLLTFFLFGLVLLQALSDPMKRILDRLNAFGEFEVYFLLESHSSHFANYLMSLISDCHFRR